MSGKPLTDRPHIAIEREHSGSRRSDPPRVDEAARPPNPTPTIDPTLRSQPYRHRSGSIRRRILGSQPSVS